jgi:hypothetical protein
MRIIRWASVALLFLVSTMLYAPAITSAASFTDVCNTGVNVGDSAVCSQKDNTTNNISGANGVIIKAANLVAIVTGVIAVFIIIVSGIKFITSSGDPNSVAGARNTLLYAVIGLIVIVLARTIVVFVIGKIN